MTTTKGGSVEACWEGSWAQEASESSQSDRSLTRAGRSTRLHVPRRKRGRQPRQQPSSSGSQPGSH